MASDDSVSDFIRSSPAADRAREHDLGKFVLLLVLMMILIIILGAILSCVRKNCKSEGDEPDENQPSLDIELGRLWNTHQPQVLQREPPHQRRSGQSQIWGPVVLYNPMTMQGCGPCSICLEEFKWGDWCRILFRCDHTYHQICIDDWLNRNPHCPLCRDSVRGRRNPDSGSNHANQIEGRPI